MILIYESLDKLSVPIKNTEYISVNTVDVL